MELDKITKKTPQKAVIKVFEETEGEEHNWFIRNGELEIYMSAKNYEEGAKYVAANFVMKRAVKDPNSHFSNFGYLYLVLLYLYAFGNIASTMWLKTISYGAAIAFAVLYVVILSVFVLLFGRWVKEVVETFKEKLAETGFNYDLEKVEKYSKRLFNEKMLYIIGIVLITFVTLINTIATFIP